MTGLSDVAAPTPGPAARRAMYAVFVVFISAGLVFASWASRIPQVRDRLDLTPGKLGFLLLALSVGSAIGIPIAGIVVARLGTVRAVTVTSITTALGLAVAAIGQQQGFGFVAAGLVVMGLGFGSTDVGMNVEGAAVEQRLGTSIMSRFHAGFSLGTVIGALVGAVMISLHISVAAHLVGVAAVVGISVPVAARSFLAKAPPVRGEAGARRRHPFHAWTERRTLLVGVSVLAAAFSEGTGNDWLGVAAIDGYGSSAAVGSLAFAVFLGAMTLGRWFGPQAIDRYGRVRAVRASCVIALLGLLLVVSGASLPLAFLGVATWGLGTALGFPVGMSAAADDPRHAAERVSVVSSIGYTAFLTGPPFIGLLADHVGVLRALSVASALLAVGIYAVGACRPLVLEKAEPA